MSCICGHDKKDHDDTGVCVMTILSGYALNLDYAKLHESDRITYCNCQEYVEVKQ